MPETPDVDPATAIAKNPYFKRASKVKPAVVITGEELRKAAEEIVLKPGEAPPAIGTRVSWSKVTDIN